MPNPIFHPATLAALLVGAAGGYLIHGALSGAVTATTGEGKSKLTDSRRPDNLRASNQRLLDQVAALKEQLARRPIAPPQPDATAAEAAATRSIQSAPDLDYEALSEVLAGIDWGLVGNNMKDMVPLLAKLGEAIQKGEQPDLGEVGELQRLNSDLMKMAQLITEAKVPGAGINGAFTHPAVVANQFSAVLKAAGMALDQDQHDKLQRMMLEFGARDQNLRLAEGDRELALESLLEEANFKQEFYQQTKGMLTDEQRAALYAGEGAGRSQLDMFDSGLMLAAYARPFSASDPKQFNTAVERTLSDRLKLGDGSRKQLAAVLADWSKRIPAEYWQTKADSLEHSGMMKSDRIRGALRRQLELTREIVNRVDLTPKQRAQLAKGRMILVPLPR